MSSTAILGVGLVAALLLAGLAFFGWVFREISRDQRVLGTEEHPVLGTVTRRRKEWSAVQTLDGHRLAVLGTSAIGPEESQVACWQTLVGRFDDVLARAREATQEQDLPTFQPTEVWLTDRIGGLTLVLSPPGDERTWGVDFEDWAIDQASEFH